MKLAPEDVEKIHTRALANLIRKVQNGGTLTGREQAMLEQAARGGPPAAVESAFAKTQGELAQRLGISRKTITNHQRDEGAPRPRDDGRYDVSAWSRFLREHGIVDEGGDEPEEKKDWRKELDKLKCEQLSLDIEVQRRGLVTIAEVVAAAGRTVNAFRTALNQLPSRIATAVLGLKDHGEIMEVVESEINVGVLQELQYAKFLDDGEDPPLPDITPEEPEISEEDSVTLNRGSKIEKPIKGRAKVPALKVKKHSKKIAKRRQNVGKKMTRRA